MMKCKFERTVGGFTLAYTLKQRERVHHTAIYIERERVGERYTFV